ncbi:hypothetical protein VKT23_015833 [Stygiomarasmius scandens]|uniref:Nucleotidyltransferase n=1 Tax=Marasmiellus scandens TaxID=2682957 RepID=A0ABR1IWM9_9AGAR
MDYEHPTPKEVRRAARAAITILNDNDFSCCLFGSLACHIYGVKYRDPKDVDLIVLNHRNYDAEDLKQLLVDNDSRFYLVDSVNPDADYQVLWYKVPIYRPGDPAKRCKVDILTTGRTTSLDIPRIPDKRVLYLERYEDLPVMPLLALLLMKLQGWHDHRHSGVTRMQRKVRQDVNDIYELLEIATGEWDLHRNNKDQRWMPDWFMNRMDDLVEEFLRKFPDVQEQWEALGLY